MAEDIVLDTRIHEPPAPGSDVDVHDEYARHTGLLREAVGGLVGEDAPKS
jgi:hypothetical protein